MKKLILGITLMLSVTAMAHTLPIPSTDNVLIVKNCSIEELNQKLAESNYSNFTCYSILDESPHQYQCLKVNEKFDACF